MRVLRLAFVVWGLLTVVNQFPRLSRRTIARVDRYAAVVPLWTFFGPRPGVFDYVIAYRDYQHKDALTDWSLVALAQPRRWFHAIYHPNRRFEKFFYDIIQGILAQRERHDDLSRIELSPAYILTLHYLETAVAHTPMADAFDFMIIRSPGYGIDEQPAEVAFRSRVHRLPETGLRLLDVKVSE